MLKIILAYLNSVRLIPHIMLMFWYRKHLREDIINNYHNANKDNLLTGFLYLMTFVKPWRNLFYYRIGRLKYLIKFLAPEYETFVISTEGEFGTGFKPAHCFATVVNADKIGKNFMVFQNVTIGMSKGKKPIIGNNVVVFANSVIVGGITIGDNVHIGAGTVLCKSVPNDCVVVGNPAYIIQKHGIKCRIKL